MPTESNPPKVFISYSHDSQSHLDRVLALADQLRAEGIDCNLDQYEADPAEGWPSWMKKQIRQADFILAVCTETYCRRFENQEEAGKGLGVTWEGALLTAELYHDKTINRRIIPVVFSAADIPHIPAEWSVYNYYTLFLPDGYDDLYRRLTNQPRTIKPPLGKLRSLPPEPRRQDFPPIHEELRSAQQNKPAPWFIPKMDEPPKPQPRHKNFIENLGNGVKLEMIAIPGGSFLMGSVDFENTRPVHRVKLSPFHIGKFQITQAQWKAVMKTNPSRFKGDNLPVENVSWDEASDFYRKLSEKTGKEYRLPTEAEWEYACRAGSTGKYCFGDDEALLKDYAWFDKNSDGKTHPVGEKKPNNWGLYDMHGNVWEWCQDWYAPNYYPELSKKGEAVNPQGPASGKYRVLRGGSWIFNRLLARAVFRNVVLAAACNVNPGFRVVLARPPSS